jgi:cytochrome P450
MNAVVSLARQFVVVRSMTVWHAHVTRDPLARLNLAEGVRDPYHLYEEVRRRGALVRSPLVGFQTASHQVCRQVLRDRRFSARVEGGGLSRGDGRLSLLELDPPDHTRLRRLVAPAFTPRAIARYRPRIEQVVDGLLDAAPPDRPWDLIAGLASPLPIAVITDLLGVPDTASAAFARYGATIGSALSGPQSLAHVARLIEADRRLNQVFAETFDYRRKEPGDDIVSHLLATGPDQLAPEELVPMCMLLLLAGFETTVNLIGNAVLALLARPDQWHAVVQDPSLAAAAIEETLRWDPPVQRTVRAPTTDLELAGVDLPQGVHAGALPGRRQSGLRRVPRPQPLRPLPHR